MKYIYYPGCSLKGTGIAYEESLLALFKKLDISMNELPDWNCCGATAYMAVDELKAFALAARNLALAEKSDHVDPISLVAPCNACYLVLSKVQKYIKEYDRIGETITDALTEVGLGYNGDVLIRHPLDVLTNDLEPDTIASNITNPLEGLNVACYYGCQIVRPYATFDDQRNPMTMDNLLQTCGANPVDWPLKTRCCGGTLTGTMSDVGLRLSYILLKEAKRRGANVIATVCPLCQFNLECYQDKMKAEYGDDIDIPIVYFSQLMGKAMGIDDKTLGLHRLFVPLDHAMTTA